MSNSKSLTKAIRNCHEVSCLRLRLRQAFRLRGRGQLPVLRFVASEAGSLPRVRSNAVSDVSVEILSQATLH